jgi:rhodanese-related sulfurtransferase
MVARHLSSFLLIIIVLLACGQLMYDQQLQLLYRNTVPLITADEFDSLTSVKEIVLLDTRSISEYNVSHIAGARHIDYDNFEAEMVWDIDTTATVVVYCSVGYRSERIGEQLIELGFTDVNNIYGGIFEWKNNDYVVVNNQNLPTDSVHAYSKLWSKWLNKGIKVYE